MSCEWVICQLVELSLGELSVGELSVGELSVGDCQSVSSDLEQRHGALSLIPPRTKKAKMYFFVQFLFFAE